MPAPRRKSLLFVAAAAALLLAGPLAAQQEQATPFSVFLDQRGLKAAADQQMPLPIWLSSVGITRSPIAAAGTVATAPGVAPEADVYRFNLRPIGSLAEALMMRVYFQDDPKARPEVTGWNEVGDCVYRSAPLGTGLDLPASAGLVLQTKGMSYLEIKVRNGAGNLRGVFFGALRPTSQWTGTDFEPPASLHDPFGNAPETKLPAEDTLLFQRIQAMLDGETSKLTSSEAGRYQFEFQLAHAPSVAILTFEVLNAEIAHPLLCQLNEGEAAPVSYQLPDLADPAYASTQFLGEANARLRYTGWMRVQKVIPGSQLTAGWNQLQLSLADGQEAAAIRAVSIQLKYPVNP